MTAIMGINNHEALSKIENNFYTSFSLTRTTGDAMNGYGTRKMWLFKVGVICDVCRKCGANPTLGCGAKLLPNECYRHSWERNKVVYIVSATSENPQDAIRIANDKAKEYMLGLTTHQADGATAPRVSGQPEQKTLFEHEQA
jgi:hypothetical protein